ncbi:MAG: LPS-assembly protein LptD [Arenicellales bacterium]
MRFRGQDNNSAQNSETIRSRSVPKLKLATVVFLLGAAGPAWSAQKACVPDVITRPAPVKPGPEGPAIELEGDQVQSIKKDTVTLTGNATMQRGAQSMQGDTLTYYRKTGEVEGDGHLKYYSKEGDRIEASHLRMNVETRIGEADDVQYRIADRHIKKDSTHTAIRARGTAKKAFMEGYDVIRMEDATYTTCREGDNTVMLYASEITLDQGTGRGLAKNLKVKLKSVPIFYFPRVSFPISNERKTGFLFPSFGAQAGSGFVLSTPYYWNIAPNYDFTLYPRLYTRRGVQVGGEFRYLTKGSRGSLYGEYLPSDRASNDKDRYAVHLRHEQDFTTRLTGTVDAQQVSDDQYLDDFSNNIEISSATVLPQQARLNYAGDIWNLQAQLYAYQVIDQTIPDTSKPYSRLPELTASSKYKIKPYKIDVGFDGQAVNFVQSTLEDGWRFDGTPFVKRKFETVWGYTEPKVSLRQTNYLLNGTDGQPDNLSRTVPVFSMDSGVYFERKTSWLHRPFIQTLEPRLFYVYIPKVNQDNFPNFDTGPVNLNNFNNMFREYRFYGADRVGDTNQVTAGLTSRLLDSETGNEWMSGSVGMIFFLQNREVNLDPNQVLDNSTSDFLAQYNAQLTNRWKSYGFVEWDTNQNNVVDGKFDLEYRRSDVRYADLSYRYTRNSIEELYLDSTWQVLPRWQVVLQDRYSIKDTQNIETNVGLQYDGCCWRVRGFFQRRAQSDRSFRNAIIFEFELTGLANIRAGV